MSFRLSLLQLLLLAMTTMTDSVSASTPPPGSQDRRTILDAARAPAQADLRKPVRFQVDALNVIDGWAFVYARMLDTDDTPIDLAGTPLAEAAARGGHSRTYAALLQRQQGQWRVLRHSTGPTDAAWLAWSDAGAPEALFQLPED